MLQPQSSSQRRCWPRQHGPHNSMRALAGAILPSVQSVGLCSDPGHTLKRSVKMPRTRWNVTLPLSLGTVWPHTGHSSIARKDLMVGTTDMILCAGKGLTDEIR